MKKNFSLTALLLLTKFTLLFGQSTSEEWNSYMETYEDGKLSKTIVRMDLITDVPVSNLPYVLVTGVKYLTSKENGFPNRKTLPTLDKMSEDLITLITNELNAIHVGSYMYNKEKLEYFYVDYNEGLEEKLDNFYINNYAMYEYHINVKKDQEWEYYKDFLYPNEDTLNYSTNDEIITDDSSKKGKRVDHWLYFKSQEDMNACKKKLETKHFSVYSVLTQKESSLPFELHVYRKDDVDVNAFFSITSELEKLAEKYNGKYEGWETSYEEE